MLIDWFTVGAQIVNFLILIYLLKRFLYKPILKAMDEREKNIADRLEQAESLRQKAVADAEISALERQELETYKEHIQQEVKKEIQQWHEEAYAKAKEEVEKARISWLEHLDQEKEFFFRKVKETLCHQVFSVAAKAVQDLADEQLEAKMITRFSTLLPEAFPADENKTTVVSDVQVKTGFLISNDQQKEIQSAVNKIFPDLEPEFIVDPGLGFGILLLAGNTKFEWNVRGYMDEMEDQVMRALTPGRIRRQ
ncbi:F0F1 ATP synthase subunit B family protein [Desulfogranum japonicum]|uniref:F0F1 ATP synthase subunit B family protein n=1 Tax=Desulfogranum japonicum TaxID=231447 RepID=UPI000423EC14|nr:hypothetical protein [Desulfogranum japonicum]